MNPAQRLLEYKRVAFRILDADDPIATHCLRRMCDEDLSAEARETEATPTWIDQRALEYSRLIAKCFRPGDETSEKPPRECATDVIEWVGYFEVCRKSASG